MKINQDFQHLFCAYKAKYSNVKHTLVFTSTYQCNRAQGAGGQFHPHSKIVFFATAFCKNYQHLFAKSKIQFLGQNKTEDFIPSEMRGSVV